MELKIVIYLKIVLFCHFEYRKINILGNSLTLGVLSYIKKNKKKKQTKQQQQQQEIPFSKLLPPA